MALQLERSIRQGLFLVRKKLGLRKNNSVKRFPELPKLFGISPNYLTPFQIARKTHREIYKILAAGIDNSTIRLFDIRTFDKGPYVSWHIPKTSDAVWTNLEFSADGTQVLCEFLLFLFTFVVDSYNDERKHAENYRCI